MVPRGDNKIATKPLLHLFSDQWQEGKQNSPPSHLHTENLCGWPNAIFYFLWRCLVNSTITEYIQQVQGESVVIEYCLKCSKQKLSLHMVTKLAAPFVWMCTSDLNAGVKISTQNDIKFEYSPLTGSALWWRYPLCALQVEPPTFSIN